MNSSERRGAGNVEWVSIESLRAYQKNSRTHSKEQIGQIAKSIKEFGFTNPVLASEEGEIIAGHGRVDAARELGMVEVPVIRLGYLTPSQRRALVIADNKIALNAGWDQDVLASELEALAAMEYDLDNIGFSDDELKALLGDSRGENFGDDDAVPEIPTKPTTKRGDVWILGRHRLLCGDSTRAGEVEKLISGRLADLVVTDPPYNVDYEGKTEEELTIQNDNMDGDQFSLFLLSAYQNMYQAMQDGAGIYVFHADTWGAAFRQAMTDAGFKLAQCCVWVKQSLVMGRQDYHWQHEPVLYGWKPSAAHRWYSDRKQTTVWSFDRPSRNTEHPTMKPVDLLAYPIENSSKRGDLVLDPFGGSGSTLIACEKTDRACSMMELDERYADVIVARWEEYTGHKAERQAG